MNSGNKQASELFSEENRLKTFQCWPRSAAVEPRALARAGLYYLGQADRVRCAFCGGTLKSWQHGDDPLAEHEAHFRLCSFVQRTETRNIPLSSARETVPGPSATFLHTQSHVQSSGGDIGPMYSSAQLNLGGDVTPASRTSGSSTQLKPCHDDFQSIEVREASFVNWPTDVTQRPRTLAEAGFFYTGSGDGVRCFCCDGALRNWEKGDDPWGEHARWFPRCPFVLQKKGQAFVDHVLNSQRVLEQMRHQPNLPFVQGEVTQSSFPVQETNEPSEDLMATAAAREAINMGFSPQLVQDTLRQLYNSLGGQTPSPEVLANALLGEDNRPVRGVHGSGEGTSASVVGSPPFVSGQTTGSRGPMPGDSDRTMCKVCMDREVAVTFLPCGHLVCCFECSRQVRECPVCRTMVKASIRTYLA